MANPTMLSYIQQEAPALQKILDTYPAQIDSALVNAPVKTNQWLVLGTGSSINAAQSAKLYMEKMAQVQLDIQEPYNYLEYGQIDPRIDFTIGISQSGQSTSTIAAIQRVVKTNKAFALAVTSRPGTEISQACQTTLDILTGREKVGYVTMGYNATVLSLMLLGLRSGVQRGLVSAAQEKKELTEFQAIVNQINPTIDIATSFYNHFADTFKAAKQYTSIGYGATIGTIAEMQTKFSEVVRLPSNGFELETFMHGPYLGVHHDHQQFFVRTHASQDVLTKATELQNYEKEYVEHVYTIDLTGDTEKSETVMALPEVQDPFKAPLLAVIPFQILAWYIAKANGIVLSHLIFEDFSDKVHNKTVAQDYV